MGLLIILFYFFFDIFIFSRNFPVTALILAFIFNENTENRMVFSKIYFIFVGE